MYRKKEKNHHQPVAICFKPRYEERAGEGVNLCGWLIDNFLRGNLHIFVDGASDSLRMVAHYESGDIIIILRCEKIFVHRMYMVAGMNEPISQSSGKWFAYMKHFSNDGKSSARGFVLVRDALLCELLEASIVE